MFLSIEQNLMRFNAFVAALSKQHARRHKLGFLARFLLADRLKREAKAAQVVMLFVDANVTKAALLQLQDATHYKFIASRQARDQVGEARVLDTVRQLAESAHPQDLRHAVVWTIL